MKFMCKHCGRTFNEKCAHNCNTGFRKRNQEWEIVDLTVADYIRFKAMKAILDADLIPMFGGRTTLLDVSDELDRTIRRAEITQKEQLPKVE